MTPEFHHQVQKRGGGREAGKMRNSQGREWALVQDQSQEPQSRVHGSCIESLDIFSEDAWVAWSAIDGH